MSFSKLIKIIGPAPSELPRIDLMKRLSTERDRVRNTLKWFRETKWVAKAKPTKKKTGGKPATRTTTKLKKAGVTIDQLEAALKLMEKEMKELPSE